MERWEISNRMCMMIMKKAIPETFRGTMSDKVKMAKEFMANIKKVFVKSEKAEIGTLLTSLISMRYQEKSNIREYIMRISHLFSKLKALKLDFSEDLLVHLVLISLPLQFSQFKVGYNSKKETWSLNELISHCVQEEDRLKQEKIESAHLAAVPKDKRKYMKRNNKEAVDTTPQEKQHYEPITYGCFFCQAAGHKKKDCTNHHAWRAKKGTPLNFVCSKVNLISVPRHRWWTDSGIITHITMSIQGCLNYRKPNDGERYIYNSDSKSVKVEAIGTFRLLLRTDFI
nr:uncharacterized protein LOC104108970 isoform X1 [Nicotiana tomentosiformis]XP_033515253.1 uncharacterized protein LOC104108970 isoform X1 [Nicotiana tomentosiformis]XP_033515254.1 uncharacterized protein LOC104108970 isoform X1 [Nicotiana tomentosiformis]